MDEDDYAPIYVRKNRETYSGMVLDSIFKYLRGAIVIVAGLVMLAIFIPFII